MSMTEAYSFKNEGMKKFIYKSTKILDQSSVTLNLSTPSRVRSEMKEYISHLQYITANSHTFS